MRVKVYKPIILLFVILFVSVPLLGQQKKNVTSETNNGLSKVTFITKQGEVSTFLPSKIHAGDVISGTVIAEPTGKNEKQLKKNKNVLNGMVVELEGKENPVKNDKLTWKIPKIIKGGITYLILKNAKGDILGKTPVEVVETPRIIKMPEELSELDFKFPDYLRAGETEMIPGMFDGDFTNSEISINDEETVILAESPEGIFFETPENIEGTIDVELQEGDFVFTDDVNMVDLNLSADKLTLAKGDDTSVNIEVTGLEGVEESVPLTISNLTPGSIKMDGGNYQELDIAASDIDENGIFEKKVDVTAQKAGGFSVMVKVEPPENKFIKLAIPEDGTEVDLSSLNFSWTSFGYPADVSYTLKLYPLDENQMEIPSKEALLQQEPLFVANNLKQSVFEIPESDASELKKLDAFLWTIDVFNGVGDYLPGDGGSNVFFTVADIPDCRCSRGEYNGKIYADVLNAANVVIGRVQLNNNPYAVLLPAEALTLRFVRADLDCGACDRVECSPSNITYNPAAPRFTPGAQTRTLRVTVTWDCIADGCDDKNCSYVYKLRYRRAPEECTCGDVQVTTSITNVNSRNGAFRGSSTSITHQTHAKSLGQQKLRPRGGLQFENGDQLEIRLSGIQVKCWCRNGACTTTAYTDADRRAGRNLTIGLGENDAEAENDNHNLVRIQARGDGWQANGDYVFRVQIRNQNTLQRNIFQDFRIRYKCEKDDCRSELCDRNFRLHFGRF